MAAETAEAKAIVDIKQEERQKDFKKSATVAEAKAVRARTQEAVRKTEKEAVLPSSRAAALAGPPEVPQAEANRHAADAATAAAVHIGSENEDDGADDDDVSKAAEVMVAEATATAPLFFREGAAHHESPVLHS